MLGPDLPVIRDLEGAAIASGLPPVVDTHVHIFPGGLFSAIWQWFDAHAWKIRYRLSTEDVFAFLLTRGVHHIVALQYAHKAGIAAGLNRYMKEKCAAHPGRITGLATVFPGEPNAVSIVKDAFDAGLSGLKLHAHVQCFDMNAGMMDPIYDLCAVRNKPIVMHVGREPKSSVYTCDPYAICHVDKLERVIRNFPRLRVCVPHLGLDELAEYRRLTEMYDNLWLDTAMVLAGYFPVERIGLEDYRADRVMYGSDFPNIPYAWDRELKALAHSGLSEGALEWILNKSAAAFFDF